MIESSDIVFEQSCVRDSIGRVFYAKGRIFRAIIFEARERILELLNSDLFNCLVAENLLVKTWISDEVTVPGYSLVLEHEPMFCSRPEEWSFEMRKAVALTAVRLNEISAKFGYYILDIKADNFAFADGRIKCLDPGSFIKGRPSATHDTYLVWSHYLPMKMISNGDGQVRIGFNMTLPSVKRNQCHLLSVLLKDIVEEYRIYRHLQINSFTTHCRAIYDLVPLFNEFAQNHLPNKISRRIAPLKRRIEYKQLNADDFNRLKNQSASKYSILPIEDSSIIQYALQLKLTTDLSAKTVLCIGNFNYDTVRELALSRQYERVNLLSQDSAYIDNAFKSVISHSDSINTICGNIVELHSAERDILNGTYGGDLVLIQDQLDIFSDDSYYPTKCDIGKYLINAIISSIAAYCKSFLLVPAGINDDFIASIRQYFIQHSSGTINGKEYILFEKKS